MHTIVGRFYNCVICLTKEGHCFKACFAKVFFVTSKNVEAGVERELGSFIFMAYAGHW